MLTKKKRLSGWGACLQLPRSAIEWSIKQGMEPKRYGGFL